MKEILLSGKQICKHYPGHGQSIVLDNVDIELYTGDFTIIMGASGAGKSTLLYVLSGMDALTEGRVLYKDREISRLGEKQMARLRSEQFGFVFQQTHLVSNLTLYENVAVAGYVNRTRSAKEVRESADHLLRQMHVAHAKDRLPNQVSGGEAQRAAVARAMINRPGLLFADEPTGALNRKNTEEVLGLLTGLHQSGQSILMVTHDLRSAIRGNRLLYLEDGAISGELPLDSFSEGAAKDREREVNAWLASMAW